MKDVEIKFEENLVKIVWPIFVEMLLFMLLGSVDVFMLGKYSDNAVGAVGIVNQVIGMLNLMFGIITSGTTIICAQYIGAKKTYLEIKKLIITSLVVNLVIGLSLSVIIFLCSDIILKIMNVPVEFYSFSKSYIDIVGGFIFFQAISMTFTATLRAFGYTKICMYTTLVMNIFNAICNYILIFGCFSIPSLGVSGAAISTTFSKVIGIIILAVFLCKNIFKDIKIEDINKFSFKELKNILKIGTPAAGEQISYSLSKLVVTVILTYIGVVAVTTNSYVNNICTFVYVFSVSIGQGTAILVGRFVGRGDRDSAYNLCLSSLKKAIIITFIMSLLFIVVGREMLKFFTSNEEIIVLGSSILIADVFLEIGRTFNVVIINSLRASGDVRFPVYVGIFSMWSIGVGVAYLLSITLGFGMIGMWIGLGLDEWFRGITMYFRWKKRKWYGKSIVEEKIKAVN